MSSGPLRRRGWDGRRNSLYIALLLGTEMFILGWMTLLEGFPC